MPPVAAMSAVRAVFRLEGLRLLADDQVHAAQHVGQHVVGFQQQAFGLQFQRHVAVAQVVGGAQQIEGRAVRAAVAHHQHRLRGGHHAHQRAVLDHQRVATTHHAAARQEHAQRAALRVDGVEAAFLPHVPVEFDLGGAFQQRGCQAAGTRDELVDGEHGCAMEGGCREAGAAVV